MVKYIMNTNGGILLFCKAKKIPAMLAGIGFTA